MSAKYAEGWCKLRRVRRHVAACIRPHDRKMATCSATRCGVHTPARQENVVAGRVALTKRWGNHNQLPLRGGRGGNNARSMWCFNSWRHVAMSAKYAEGWCKLRRVRRHVAACMHPHDRKCAFYVVFQQLVHAPARQENVVAGRVALTKRWGNHNKLPLRGGKECCVLP